MTETMTDYRFEISVNLSLQEKEDIVKLCENNNFYVDKVKHCVYNSEPMSKFELVYSPSSELVAFTKYLCSAGLCSEIQWLLVDKNHRNKSIGKQLITHSLNLFKLLNSVCPDRMPSLIVQCKKEAVLYWMKHGFRLTGIKSKIHYLMRYVG